MSSKKVVITDFSVVSPIGTNRSEFEESLRSGKSGIIDVRERMEADKFPVKAMGLVDTKKIHTVDGWTNPEGYIGVNEFLIHIMNDFREKVFNPDAIIIGADAVDYSPENLRAHLIQGAANEKPKPLEIQSAAYVLRNYLAHLGNNYIDNEHVYTVNSTCTSGLVAMGMAKRMIESGRYRRVLVGATEKIPFPNYVYPLIALGALSLDQGDPSKVSKPFDKDRSGFVKSEGAALFLVQSEEAAAEMKATPLAQVMGFGQSSDAYRLTDGLDDGSQAAAAIKEAITKANLKLLEISCISAHGTATRLNDKHESTALRSVFKNDLSSIPITALKSQVGHATAACAALQLSASLLMLNGNFIPPILNLKETDCGNDLNFVRERSLDQKIQTICNNAFGFGGHNACLIVGKP